MKLLPKQLRKYGEGNLLAATHGTPDKTVMQCRRNSALSFFCVCCLTIVRVMQSKPRLKQKECHSAQPAQSGTKYMCALGKSAQTQPRSELAQAAIAGVTYHCRLPVKNV